MSADESKQSANRGVALTWDNLEYRVTPAGQTDALQVVKPFSGHVPVGGMLCILGPSGSGKTSVLNVLTGRLKQGGQHDIGNTKVYFSGKERNTSIERLSGYCTQDDVQNAMLTVEETLNFAVQLRSTLPKDARNERVQRILGRLQLLKSKNTRVGDPHRADLKGLSGGERRRLSIAEQIVGDLSLLFLDEPTSGLDAASAMVVCTVLRQLADEGITVVATLHQPRPAIMRLFTQVLVLAAGRVAYFGPQEAFMGYFAKIDKLPEGESATDWVLDMLVAPEQESAEHTAKVNGICDAFGENDLSFEMAKNVSEAVGGGLLENEKAALEKVMAQMSKSRYMVPWCTQFTVLLVRTFLIKIRDPIAAVTQISTALIMGLIFGALYWQSYDSEDPFDQILDVQMAVAMTSSMLAFLPFDCLLTFPAERQVYIREHFSSMYSTSAFFLSRILADTPTVCLAGVIFTLSTHLMIGLKISLLTYMGYGVLCIQTGVAVLHLIGAVSQNFEQANGLATMVILLFMMISPGFLRQVPGWLEWCSSSSYVAHSIALVTDAEFEDFKGTEYENLIADGPSGNGVVVCLVELVVCRFLTYVAFRFLYTGRPVEYLMHD